MVREKKVIVIMPAYNAAKTLERTYNEIPKKYVDEMILVDDASSDHTVKIAKHLGIETIIHPKNRGYGGNQKTCYTHALKNGADIVVMVHPDYQYDPRVIPQMIQPIKDGEADIVFGSRMVKKKDALKGGMPYYKFISNIFLTTLENIVFMRNLSEYHTGLRAYSRKFLESVDFRSLSEDFVFDTQMIARAVEYGYVIGEVPIVTRYQKDSSSISLKNSITYGLLTLKVLLDFLKRKQKRDSGYFFEMLKRMCQISSGSAGKR